MWTTFCLLYLKKNYLIYYISMTAQQKIKSLNKEKDEWLATRNEALKYYNDLKKDNLSNIEILEAWKILNFYSHKDVNEKPNDLETIFLMYEKILEYKK
tara:strand:+ start:6665 stop:6961 length:297 start_codon:yes stop_codon:yes gene_type:complete